MKMRLNRCHVLAAAALSTLSSSTSALAGVVTGTPVNTFQTIDASRDITLTPSSPVFNADLSTYSSFSNQLHSLLGLVFGGDGSLADVEHQDASSPDPIHGDIALPYAMLGRNANGEYGYFVYKFKLGAGQTTGVGGTIDTSVYFRHDPDGTHGRNAYIGVAGTIGFQANNSGITNASDFSKLTMENVFGPGNTFGNAYNEFATYTGDTSLAIPSGLNEFYVIVTDESSSARFALNSFAVDAVIVGGGDPNWAVNGSGDWNTAANWTVGVPNGSGAVAVLGSAINAPRTIFTDTAITLGKLKFDNASSYQVTGQGSLTLQVNSGAATVELAQGAHKINLPSFYASNTSIEIASGATLTISNPMTIRANQTVTKTGALLIEAPLTLEANATLVNAGGRTSIFGAPSMGAGAEIDVGTGSVQVDYRGQASPANAIRSLLASGYASGAWTGSGINTSSATPSVGLGWRDNTSASEVLVKFALYGDADLSGSVNLDDFTALAAGFGQSNVWAGGDFNYDGVTNLDDFTRLASNFGATLPSEAQRSSVPEPGLASVFFMSSALLAFRRRRGTGTASNHPLRLV